MILVDSRNLGSLSKYTVDLQFLGREMGHGLTGSRIDPETADILDTAQFQDTVMKEDPTPLPREFNVPWEEEHIRRTEVRRPVPIPDRLVKVGDVGYGLMAVAYSGDFLVTGDI